jgi:hypothetical protein
MKKQNIFLAIVILMIVNQHTMYAQWAITGNATTNPTTNFVGTTDNVDLVFRTNNTEKVRIQSSGDVGIGTTSPSYKLDVKETANNANATIRAQATGTNGNANLILNKYATADNCMVNYKYGSGAGLTNLWATGCRTNDDYSIYNENLAVTNFMVQRSTGFVGIGTTSPGALLHVEKSYSTGSANNYLSKLYLTNSGSGCLNYGSDIYMASTGSASTVTGQFIFASGLSDNNVLGGYYTAGAGASNYGLVLSAQQGGNDYGLFANAQYGSGDVYGVWAEATNTNNSGNLQGVHAEANDNGGTHSTVYGIYAKGPSASCSSPYNTTLCPKAAGYFAGDVVYSGTLYGTSDMMLKDNIMPLQNASTVLSQLMPKSFLYRSNDFPTMNLSQGTHYGMIAQELENVLPDLVKMQRQPEEKDSLGNIIHPMVDYKSINYMELIPFLVQANNEQQQQINDLQAAIAVLQSGNKTAPVSNELEIKLSDRNTIILDQNQPNPFKENTTIKYNIPDNVKSAQILFYNSKGNVINTVEINTKGEGSLLVYGSDLSSGIYTYSLLVDGKVMETKKMVKL